MKSVFHQALSLQFDSSCGVGLVALLLHLVKVRPCKLVPLESKLVISVVSGGTADEITTPVLL